MDMSLPMPSTAPSSKIRALNLMQTSRNCVREKKEKQEVIRLSSFCTSHLRSVRILTLGKSCRSQSFLSSQHQCQTQMSKNGSQTTSLTTHSVYTQSKTLKSLTLRLASRRSTSSPKNRESRQSIALSQLIIVTALALLSFLQKPKLTRLLQINLMSKIGRRCSLTALMVNLSMMER